jgi:glucose/sorbosone dehydrogenase
VLLGKILRITRDGAIPPTNPFQGADSSTCAATGMTSAGRKCRETFAWGLRNPFRLAFDPNSDTTRFFINDVGEITWEEIDQGTSGADYGWNVREGHCATGSQTDCGTPPAGMTNPIYDYNHGSGCMSITGGAFVPNGIWPVAYDGSYLFADLVCGKIFKLTQGSSGSWSQTDFAQGFGGYSLIDLTFDSHGQWALYYITWNAPGQEIHRIVYTGQPRGYARPKGATPMHVSLVPAFNACTGPNRTHGAPLASGACNPPVQSSSQLTVGTLDANGQTANANARVRYDVIPGNPLTTPNEANVKVVASLTDVRRKSTLADYTGELQLDAALRITDRLNGPAQNEPATVADIGFPATIACTSTTDTAIGSTCSLTTTFNAVVPGAVLELQRSNWQLGQVKVYDGGADGVASTTQGNTLFMNEGIFVP